MDANSPEQNSGEKSDEQSLAETLFTEFLERRQSGETVHPEEYLKRCPGNENALQKLFDSIDESAFRHDQQSPNKEEKTDYIGEFKIIREIGRGSMGTVFEAEQQFPRRRVALKVLPSHLTLSDKNVLRFKQEADAGVDPVHQIQSIT